MTGGQVCAKAKQKRVIENVNWQAGDSSAGKRMKVKPGKTFLAKSRA